MGRVVVIYNYIYIYIYNYMLIHFILYLLHGDCKPTYNCRVSGSVGHWKSPAFQPVSVLACFGVGSVHVGSPTIRRKWLLGGWEAPELESMPRGRHLTSSNLAGLDFELEEWMCIQPSQRDSRGIAWCNSNQEGWRTEHIQPALGSMRIEFASLIDGIAI